MRFNITKMPSTFCPFRTPQQMGGGLADIVHDISGGEQLHRPARFINKIDTNDQMTNVKKKRKRRHHHARKHQQQRGYGRRSHKKVHKTNKRPRRRRYRKIGVKKHGRKSINNNRSMLFHTFALRNYNGNKES